MSKTKDQYSEMTVEKYAEGMPHGELRIQRSINVPEASAEGRLPTLTELAATMDIEWDKGKGFDEGKYRYESGINHPITEESLESLNRFWFESKLLSHKGDDGLLATRFISGWVARAEASSHYPSGSEEGTMLITHGLAVFDEQKNMKVEKWYFDLHTHPGHSFRANSLDLLLSLQRSEMSFIVSESGVCIYGGEVDITLDDLMAIGIELDNEDLQKLGQNLHFSEYIQKYTHQLLKLAGENYFELDQFAGEDTEKICEFLGIPFRLVKWNSEEMKSVLDYMNGNSNALDRFDRKVFEAKFSLKSANSESQ